MSDVAIRADGLCKKYTIGGRRNRHDTLRDHFMEVLTSLGGRNGNGEQNDETIWALKDVSFEVKQGDVVGIMGRNGAGKSTLLKILCSVTTPTAGNLEVRGRVGSLLEVGTGFHPELTGRENVYLNGAILGMKKAQIESQFDAIVDFSGVEKFIDTPVKRYSSGMYVRLAFAVAAHLDSEILIVDEALAVGDVEFQKKCLARIENAAKDGRTTLLVSHSMEFITNLAQEAMFLDKGENKFFGDVDRAVALYSPPVPEETEAQDLQEFSRRDLREISSRPSGVTPALTACRITDSESREKRVFSTGEEFCLEMEYSCDDNAKLSGAAMRVFSPDHALVGRLNTFMCSRPPYRIPPKGKIRFRLPELPLCPGDYLVTLALFAEGEEVVDLVSNAVDFSVKPSKHPAGTGYVLGPWDGFCVLKGSCEIDTLERSAGFGQSVMSAI